MSIKNIFVCFASFVLKGVVPGSLVISYKYDKNKKKYLFLVIKSKHSNAITFPSGSLNLGESFAEAAERELKEETGFKSTKMIPTKVVHTFRYRNLPIKFKGFQKVFLAEVGDDNSTSQGDKDVLWVKWEDREKVLSLLTYDELKGAFLHACSFMKKNE